jgi:hypothetical protein
LGQLFLYGQTTISIAPKFQNESLELDHIYNTGDSLRYSISTFRCYVSHVKGITANGHELLLSDIALVDMEDPSSFILGRTNESLRSISFLVGTDSITNVSGILEGPLDPIRGMYWTWNSGYINFKLEGKVIGKTGSEKTFEYHIGGYLSPHATARTIQFDLEPNSEKFTIQIHLDEWLEQIDMEVLPSVMMPGKDAVRLADELVNVFKESRNE